MPEGGVFQQPLFEHLNNVANATSLTLSEVGFSNLGALLGFVHDVGKCRKEWQKYINDDSGNISHSFYGSLFLEKYSDNNGWDKVLRHMLGVIINSHHSFLKNMSEYRLLIEENETSSDNAEILDFVKTYIGTDVFKSIYEKAVSELQLFDEKTTLFLNKLFPSSDKDSKAMRFKMKALFLALLTRIVFSALVDADRLDAANFNEQCEGKPVAIEHDGSKGLWSDMIHNLDVHLSRIENSSAIDLLRSEISVICAEKGRENKCLLRFCAPTGSGKTLSGMRFALEHSLFFGKKRIFYVAPFTTILDQTHDVMASVFGDENLLIHHSSFELPDMKDEHIREVLAERWNSPIVVTTLVQFLNALFNGDSNCARRMHKLIDSVIIFDEIQTLPPHCRYLFNVAVSFLTEFCNCTVVLCSATQPPYESLKYPTKKPVDIIENAEDYFKKFSRVRVIDARRESGCSINSLTSFVKEKHKVSTLIVTNTKQEAKLLYQELKSTYKTEVPSISVFHLSTNMCAAHRRKILRNIKAKLKNGEPLICVSTSLIEAGLDISFRVVMRFPAGLDSITQAAGRCNRNGEEELGTVYIVNGFCSTKKTSIDNYAKITALNYVTLCSAHEDSDLSSPNVINAYYKKYYNEIVPTFVSKDINTNSGNHDIVNLLSDNTIRWKESVIEKPEFYNEGGLYLHQSFRDAGNSFKVIDDNTVSVIVPYNDDAVSIIKEIHAHGPSPKLLKRSRDYVVAAFVSKIKENNFFIPVGKSGIYTIPKDAYDSDAIGLDYDYDVIGDLCL